MVMGTQVNGVASVPTANGLFATNPLTLPVGTYTVTLTILSPTGCPPITTQVTVGPCIDCCPNVKLNAPTVTGCAPTNAVASFAALVVWKSKTLCHPVPATSFVWTLDSMGGTKFTRVTTGPTGNTTDTNGTWTDVATGNQVAVNFGNGGTFSVSVIATVPGFSITDCPGLTDNQSFTVPECCPVLTGLTASLVPGLPCSVVFSATVSNPTGAPVAFAWSFTDGSPNATTASPTVAHTFPMASASGGATVTLTSPNCMDQLTTAVIALPGCTTCPAIGTPTAAVTGCIGSGSVASVTLSTSVTPPAAGSSVNWTVTTPSGKIFTKTTPTTTTTDGVADGSWLNAAAGTMGPLDVTATGAYGVSVTASGPAIPAGCPGSAPRGFAIPPCPGGGTNWGCVISRWIAVILLIIAGFLWMAYFCVGPVLPPPVAFIAQIWFWAAIGMTVTAIVILLVWALSALCPGKPCMWFVLLSWQVSIGFGVVALYFVACCLWAYAIGFVSLAVGIGLLIFWWIKCKRTACQVVVELAPVISAVLVLIAYAILFSPLKMCLSVIVGAIVAVASALLVIALASCASSGAPSGS